MGVILIYEKTFITAHCNEPFAVCLRKNAGAKNCSYP